MADRKKLSSSFYDREVAGFVMQIEDDGVTITARCVKCQSSLRNLDANRLKRHRQYCDRERLFPNRSHIENRTSPRNWTGSPAKDTRPLRDQQQQHPADSVDGNNYYKARLVGASSSSFRDASPIVADRRGSPRCWPDRSWEEPINHDLVKYLSERQSEAQQEVAELRLNNKILARDNRRLASVLLRTQKKMNSLRYHLNGLCSISLVNASNPNYIV
ncbi:uncharacterized protein LOC106656666 [Trichogramma pretiosum]|uniref:uncharacterized protein LOC106656666 n=1 Tax=Trichogramma pretiosum TaxID=7493 RepID=UPI0006C94CF1|nr:uncharacterized protein LOC106656666 [Trichogramma pretiosum]